MMEVRQIKEDYVLHIYMQEWEENMEESTSQMFQT